jgi:hypothetical protein
MPRTPTRGAGSDLTAAEKTSLEYGDTPGDKPGFLTDALRREAWENNRDLIVPRWIGKAMRPQAWWDYDAPKLAIRFPSDPDEESAVLWRGSLLTADEVTLMMGMWRGYFDEAQAPDFVLPIGPGAVLKGPAARVAQYQNYGIPKELLKKWKRERERRAKTIAALAVS